MVCLDEKPIQLHDHVREPKGLRPGKCRRVDYEYKRNGICNAFCCVEPKVGVYSVNITDHRKAEDYCRANQRDSGKLSKGRKDRSGHGQSEHPFGKLLNQTVWPGASGQHLESLYVGPFRRIKPVRSLAIREEINLMDHECSVRVTH